MGALERGHTNVQLSQNGDTTRPCHSGDDSFLQARKMYNMHWLHELRSPLDPSYPQA